MRHAKNSPIGCLRYDVYQHKKMPRAISLGESVHPGPEYPGWGEPGQFFLLREERKEKYAVKCLETRYYI